MSAYIIVQNVPKEDSSSLCRSTYGDAPWRKHPRVGEFDYTPTRSRKGKREKQVYIRKKPKHYKKKWTLSFQQKVRSFFFYFFKTKDTQEAWFAAVSCPFWLKRFLRRRGQGDEEFPRSRRQSSSSFLARWRGGMYIRSPRHVLFLILFPCHSSTLAFFRFYRVAQCTLSPTWCVQ